jgi:subtilisin family serine protease
VLAGRTVPGFSPLIKKSAPQDPLCQAVEQAWQAGIVVVVAAGNDERDNSLGTQGYGTITVPGNDPYVITVGAMKSEDTATRIDDLIELQFQRPHADRSHRQARRCCSRQSGRFAAGWLEGDSHYRLPGQQRADHLLPRLK